MKRRDLLTGGTLAAGGALLTSRLSFANKDNEMSSNQKARPPLHPFTLETAIEKVRLAEDGWNTRDASKVALAYLLDTKWQYHWPLGRRPDDHPGLSELGL